jgi:hypothetical protein
MVRRSAQSLAILVCVDGPASYVAAFRKIFRHQITGKPGHARLVANPGLRIGQVIKRYSGRHLVGVVRGEPAARGDVPGGLGLQLLLDAGQLAAGGAGQCGPEVAGADAGDGGRSDRSSLGAEGGASLPSGAGALEGAAGTPSAPPTRPGGPGLITVAWGATVDCLKILSLPVRSRPCPLWQPIADKAFIAQITEPKTWCQNPAVDRQPSRNAIPSSFANRYSKYILADRRTSCSTDKDPV